MEEMNPNIPNSNPDSSIPSWKPHGIEDISNPAAPFFPTGRREMVFACFILIWGLLTCNCVLYGGLNLGFAIGAAAVIVTSAAYLLYSGCRLTAYSAALLGLSLAIAASFARSADSFVKFVMFCFLLAGVNLELCVLAGKNRRNPGGIRSLADGLSTAFVLGIGKIPLAFRGMKRAFANGGTAGRKGGAVALGLLIALPVLGILIPLLARADAAFNGLLEQLPDFDFWELPVTLILGGALSSVLYTRAVALSKGPKEAPVGRSRKKGLNGLTINTVLIAVDLVYAVYLFSQLAYFVGGFSGILPDGFTMAEYARRGFFEMAWLCAIDLVIMALAVSLADGDGRATLATRLLCLFIGVVTVFLVASASAKMFLYIGAYGLTRLRVLTEVIMVWLGLTTLFVMIWLFVPQMPYMKAVMLSALLIGAIVSWVDVDTVVAQYNVTAYQSGRLETVDLEHLAQLSSGAVPYIAQLTEDADPEVARQAWEILEDWRLPETGDFRGWNFADQAAADARGLLPGLWR